MTEDYDPQNPRLDKATSPNQDTVNTTRLQTFIILLPGIAIAIPPERHLG